jgi:aminoglycoside phosphotransferase family enzyme
LIIPTDAKVRFLSSSEAYAHRPRAVVVKETHMSWVFVAGDSVYKLKKPVHYPFLDFRNIAAREKNCREEVRLNRRLAPDVYLGVVPLTIDETGRLAVAGQGEVVDWLVEMRRLPENHMLDQAILTKRLERGQTTQLDAVVHLLTKFFKTCPPAEISPEAYVQRFAREHAINEAVLSDSRFDLDGAEVNDALVRVRRGLEDGAAGLEERVKRGYIVEGHGDLRPEHICLLDPPIIIDCLEFSYLLRLVDPFDELSYLALECAMIDATWVGERIFDGCAEALRDVPSTALLDFYWTYRACLRARLALTHLLDPHPRTPEKWGPLARHYIRLAQSRVLKPALRAVP